MKEAAVGATGEKAQREPGFEVAQIAAFLRANADKLEKAKLPERAGFATGALAREEAGSLREMAEAIDGAGTLPRLEDLETRSAACRAKLVRACLAATSAGAQREI